MKEASEAESAATNTLPAIDGSDKESLLYRNVVK